MSRSYECIPTFARAFTRSFSAATSSTKARPPRKSRRSSGRLTRGPLRFSQKADCQIAYVAESRRSGGVTEHVGVRLGHEAFGRGGPVYDARNFGQGHDQPHQRFALDVDVDRENARFVAGHVDAPGERGRNTLLSLARASTAEDLIDMRTSHVRAAEDVQ